MVKLIVSLGTCGVRSVERQGRAEETLLFINIFFSSLTFFLSNLTNSNISYESNYIDGKKKSKAYRNQGSTLGATALIAGTTIGAGVLALPTATAALVHL